MWCTFANSNLYLCNTNLLIIIVVIIDDDDQDDDDDDDEYDGNNDEDDDDDNDDDDDDDKWQHGDYLLHSSWREALSSRQQSKTCAQLISITKNRRCKCYKHGSFPFG